MAGVALLREIMRSGGPDTRTTFAPGRLRFVLETVEHGKAPRAVAASMVKALGDLIGSRKFDLEPLFEDTDPDGTVFVVMSIRGVDRTLPPDRLYAIAEEIRRSLKLVSCEPDIGADAYVDPEEETPPGTESAVVDGYCWTSGDAPNDKMWALASTNVPGAWAISPSMGAGVIIAQPDTGITDHPEVRDAKLDLDISLNILEGGKDPTDPLRPGTANPGHGTGTGSVAAGGRGGSIAGSAPKATLVPIRCIEDVKIFDGSPVAKAIDYAVSIGAHVITMSLGGIASRSMKKAIRKAVERDLIVLAAAGNCIGLVVWPAAFDDVIAVGGSNIKDERWQGSSFGSKIDFCAPAEFVWRAERKSTADSKGLVSGGQGTSFAVALTAGIAALWLSRFGRQAVAKEARRRSTSVQELFRAAARQSARRPTQWGIGLGAGVIDANALLSLPLKDILSVPKTTSAAEAGGIESALRSVLGPGTFDTRFDYSANGAELSALLIADAKAGRRTGETAAEARSFKRASRGLMEAAGLSADPRLAQISLRSGLAAPALVTKDTVGKDRLAATIKRVASIASGTGGGPQEAARKTAKDAQDTLDTKGRQRIMKPLHDRLAHSGNQEFANDLETMEGSLERLHRDGPSADLSDHEAVQLEALVSLTDRPALKVFWREEKRGRVQTIDASDRALGGFEFAVNNALPALESSRLGSVGRIDLDGTHVGTGFVVADGLVVTNRHVVESIASPIPRAENPKTWVLNSAATIDFSPSANDPDSRFAISAVRFAGPKPILSFPIDYDKLDLAVLEVDRRSATKRPLPKSIPISTDVAFVKAAVSLCVIGYPAPPQTLPRDERDLVRRDVVDRLRDIFGVDYHIKYFSPGLVQALENHWVFDHDATTIAGNSGSVVTTLEGNFNAIGLHFAGDWLRANHAHILAEVLAAVPELHKLLLKTV
ncbi:peptidase S8/S53 subtilisin kexin sedolisin [Rhizobium leguminosarum bv. viciae]|uniref:S8 family serine peptidase n=1 Tax=Rhizobium ruizarguesonis TaxID=2081791 RepID=UPI0010404078|nr:S8 family serine peptidase [Rhizobium ruizarguesonis]MBY5806092.1 S8 family serine peptidase [Rhizobium leguminosarum]TBY53333.1 peptidase S8/S53 subtilisin kexin sedolisin [Rhizobium leguminosarum bv. viciae]MBY5846870.1 S8 family serine peptidase [Rhizobium leguminosarum]NEH87943.1 S8 family serine peptidase [Rhizobium ruizarguesonis]NEJ58082.1 S8 family serine peptidase [Rhizobium ruizarguesonis]